MMDLITLIAWIAAGATTGFFVARKYLRHEEETLGVEGLNYLLAAVFWLFGGIPWPIVLTGLAVVHSLKRDHEKNDPTLREERLREREQHIRDLERELGIR